MDLKNYRGEETEGVVPVSLSLQQKEDAAVVFAKSLVESFAVGGWSNSLWVRDSLPLAPTPGSDSREFATVHQL
jgi:hypothetical protein